MTGRRFAAILGMGPLPQPGAALVVRQVHDDGRIELAPADATDLGVAQKDLEQARRDLSSATSDREDLRTLLERCRGYLVAVLGSEAMPSLQDTWSLYDDINTELRR